MIWRLVISRVATLMEIENHYSLEDVLSCNEALDLQEEAKEAAQKLAAPKRKG